MYLLVPASLAVIKKKRTSAQEATDFFGSWGDLKTKKKAGGGGGGGLKAGKHNTNYLIPKKQASTKVNKNLLVSSLNLWTGLAESRLKTTGVYYV